MTLVGPVFVIEIPDMRAEICQKIKNMISKPLALEKQQYKVV